MNYGSVCSGMEAATCAWHPLGWTPAFVSEIDPTASRLLAGLYPDVPNLGDMTKFQEWPDYAIDLLVGGTPCQSFSIAGLRKGLADPRGNLMLTYLAIVDRYRPRWLVWENVPGVLSSNRGRDFGTFLGGLAQLGYGFAYRVLDAQFVRVQSHPGAVPQRRRRVFVVGHLGDWRRAAAVLFERESLSGHPPPRRQAGKGFTRDVAPSLTSSGRGVERTGETRKQDPVVAEVTTTLPAGGNSTGGDRQPDTSAETAATMLIATYAPDIVPQAMSSKWSKGSSGPAGDEVANLVAHTLKAEVFDASEDGTGRGTPIVPIAIQAGATRENPDSGPDGVGIRQDGASYTLEARAEVQAVAYRTAGDGAAYEEGDATAPLTTGTDRATQVLAFQSSQSGIRLDDVHATLDGNNGSRRHNGVLENWAVRRLTPTECLRLQGFPDDYFDRARLNKPLADGPKYKMLGNSMAVNVMSWIGQRIELVEGIKA